MTPDTLLAGAVIAFVVWVVMVATQHAQRHQARQECYKKGHVWRESDHPTHIVHTCDRCGYRAGRRDYEDDDLDE